MASAKISEIYKSRITLLDLMRRQGYNVTDYEGFSINEINTMNANNQLDMILEKKSSNDEEDTEKMNRKTYIKYYLSKSLRPANLQEMIDDLFMVEEILTKEDTLLIVVKDEVNETMSNALKHIWESEKIFIILYPLKRLQFNVLDHRLNPPHRVLSEAEKISLMSKYNITRDDMFPEIERSNPVAKSIGIRPGEVCEILRPSKTAIVAPHYRICT